MQILNEIVVFQKNSQLQSMRFIFFQISITKPIALES